MIRINKPATALKYLEKALSIVKELLYESKNLEVKANIFLNLSSVHSLRSKHDISLNYCSQAILILSDLYNKVKAKSDHEPHSGSKNDSKDNDEKVKRINLHSNLL